MKCSLAATGTSALLEELSPYVPDDLINQLLPAHRGRGRPAQFSSAQLLRVLLLALLTPARSFNLLTTLLAEHRPWRHFGRLANRHHLPSACMLHEFRQRLAPLVMRRINGYLLRPLLEGVPADRCRLALIDSTDLPAACSAYKKRLPVATRHEALL